MKGVLEKAFEESAILPLAHVSRHGLSALQQRHAPSMHRLPHIRHETYRGFVSLRVPAFSMQRIHLERSI
ncbi:hypothetical protein [Pandoraea oxalativorans]|uniref:hypothetical protein n=1 Tax=Pandoraea oxalativorans TaxID=573737 RepID=UPI000AA6822C|nr:hypothetical protein [Pandoraea oxalativorans]